MLPTQVCQAISLLGRITYGTLSSYRLSFFTIFTHLRHISAMDFQYNDLRYP